MADQPLVAGVDLGGTKILGRVLHPADPRAALHEVRIDTPRGADAIIDALDECVRRLGESEAVRSGGGVTRLGVGVAGLVDLAGVLRFGPNLPGVTDLAVGPSLSARLGLPVHVDNDANCALWCEAHLGVLRGSEHAVLVTLGTGIGAALLSNGVLVRGAHGMAGEPGHMMISPQGPPCPCGRRGCWERYASGSGLGRLGRDAAAAGRADRVVALAGGDPEAVRGEHVTAAAAEGDAEAVAVLGEFAWWVAVGIANLVDILDPQAVVIGGGLAAAGEQLLTPVREALVDLVVGADERPPPEVVAAMFGAEAGAIGAGLLALPAAT